MSKATLGMLLLIFSALSVQLYLVGNRDIPIYNNQLPEWLLVKILSVLTALTGLILLSGKRGKSTG